MKIVAGLGNPGDKYQLNRHNIGFMIIDHFAQKRKIAFKIENDVKIAKRNKFTLIKPQTYMNLSGKAIKKYANYTEDILVICDDIYLPFGEIRIRQSGGDGGHNGLNSIIYELNSEDFNRMRIGVGQPQDKEILKQYVLEDFDTEEQKKITTIADFTNKLIECFITEGFQSMINNYSKNKKSYSEKINSESKTTGGT